MTQDAIGAQDPLPRFIGRQPAFSPAQGSVWDESQRYRLISVLGEGGFGKVYQAEDTFAGNALVAIKSINLSGLSATQMIEATDGFNREVQLLSNLSHPHLPRIHDHFTDPEHWYLVLDFIPGESLERFMQVHQNYQHLPDGTGFTPGGPLTLAEIFDLALQLCDVLGYLHAHRPPIIFRDLKPSNIMRTPPGQHFLIDFGIARHFKPGQAKDTIPFGSPGYAAPEQYGREQTTPRADIYSLGALLHHLLTGHDPAENGFAFAPLPELPPALQGLDAFLRKMLAMHPEERPSSMDEIRDELEYFMSWVGLLPSGPDRDRPRDPVSPLARPPVNAGRRAALIGLASVAGVIIVGGLGAEIVSHLQSQRRMIIVNPVFSRSTIPAQPATSTPSTSPTPPPNTSMAASTLFTYRGHSAAVQSVDWSPDGTRVVSAGDDAQVHVWDARTGRLYLRLLGHQDSVQAVGWSPDGQYIASGSRDQTVRVWNASTGGLVSIYRGHSYAVNTLAWAPANIGQQIASAGDAQETHIWFATSGQLNYIHSTPGKDVSAPPYNRTLSVTWGNAQMIASAGDGSTTQAWGGPNSQSGDTTFAANTGQMAAIAWSPDFGRLMAFAGVSQEGQTLGLWDMFGGSAANWSFSLQGAAQSPNTTTLPLSAWNTGPGNAPLRPRSMFAPKAGLAWSPDWLLIVACSANIPTVSVVNGQSGTFKSSYSGHSTGVNAVACSSQTPKGCALVVASAGVDRTVRIWSIPGACIN